MADFLCNNLSNSFIFTPPSLPFNLSRHPNFSFIRFTPLKRRFSRFTSLASHSSQLHIISRTVHADGSVIFKFGDASEVTESVDDFDGGNEVELEKDDDSSELAEEISVVKSDNVDEVVVKSSVELKEIDDDFVEDEQKDDLTATVEEVENSSDFVEDELRSDLHSTEVVENLSNSISTAELQNSKGFVKHALESDSNLSVEVRIDSKATAEVENLSNSVDELKTVKSDLNSTADVDDSADFDTVRNKNGVNTVASTYSSSVDVMIKKGDTLSEDYEEISSDESIIISDRSSEVEAVTWEDEIKENVVEEGNDTVQLISEPFEEQIFDQEDDDKAKSVSEHLNAEPIVGKEDKYKVELLSERLEVEPILDEEDEDAVELMSKQFEAEPILDEEASSESLDNVVALGADKVALPGHPSIANLDHEPITHDISDAPLGVEASGLTSTEMDSDSLNSVEILSVAAPSQLSSEVNGATPSTIYLSDDDQHYYDISQDAGPGPGSSSVETSTVVSFMTPEYASLPDSAEVYDITANSIAQSDDQSHTLFATGPVTPGITSVKANLDSLSKVEIAALSFSVSSAVATLAHSLEDLTGGKDSYFVSDNWFGVADGVGQWSFGGVDIGLYAHELMQNCEKLLKSTNVGLTNVKELLQKSAAMTQSTGSARVIIAHVADQVLHVANIGDSGFLIIRNGTVFKKSSPMFHEFSFPYAIGLDDDSVEDAEEYHIELEDCDVIVTATDGLFDNLYDQEIASIVSKAVETGTHGTRAQGLAEILATKAQEVGLSESARSPFADAAQAAGHSGYSGGKFDHVTVIVSLVHIR